MAALQSAPNLGDSGFFPAALLEDGTSVLTQANKSFQKGFVTSQTWAAQCFVLFIFLGFFFFFLSKESDFLFLTLSERDE